jgi:branched-chain amino acid transport system substrate-binding protein
MNRLEHMSRLAKQLVTIAALLLPTAAMAQQPTIKVGGIFALSGPAAALGLSASEGVRYAIEDINKAGGLDIKGTKYIVEYTAYDDQFKPAEAVAAYTRLVERDKTKYIFTMFSASHMAIKSMSEADDVFVLTSAISPKAIEADTKHAVRIQTLVQDYVPGMIKWIRANVSGDKVALFYPNDESGWQFATLTTAQFEKAGFKIVSKELTERQAKDFQSALTRVIALNPDVIDLGVQTSATAGLIVRQARELGYKKAFVILGGTNAFEIVGAAGNEASEGIVHMVFADAGNPNYKPIADRYRQKVGQLPNELIVNFYDGTVALMKALQASGQPDKPQTVREAFPKVFPMKSLQGDMLQFGGKETLGVDAQLFSRNYIAIIKNGAPVVVGATN